MSYQVADSDYALKMAITIKYRYNRKFQTRGKTNYFKNVLLFINIRLKQRKSMISNRFFRLIHIIYISIRYKTKKILVIDNRPVSYTHLRAHETVLDLV